MNSRKDSERINWREILESMSRTPDPCRSQHTNIKNKCIRLSLPISKELNEVAAFLSYVKTLPRDSEYNSHDYSVRMIDDKIGLMEGNLEIVKKKEHEKRTRPNPRAIRKIHNPTHALPKNTKDVLAQLVDFHVSYSKTFVEQQKLERKSERYINFAPRTEMVASLIPSMLPLNHTLNDLDLVIEKIDTLVSSTGLHFARDMESYLSIFTREPNMQPSANVQDPYFINQNQQQKMDQETYLGSVRSGLLDPSGK